MPTKTVFISSTYRDLAEHRRKVWDALKRFDVSVSGMEEFGARTAGALETCLGEVEQSDVYVGIIAYRLGSIDSTSRKPFTQLEYEHALDLKKDILIYIADENAVCFPVSAMDDDGKARRRLRVFKDKLKERHTVGSFSTPDDLSEKLSRDFKTHFEVRQEEKSAVKGDEEELAKSGGALRNFS